MNDAEGVVWGFAAFVWVILILIAICVGLGLASSSTSGFVSKAAKKLAEFILNGSFMLLIIAFVSLVVWLIWAVVTS